MKPENVIQTHGGYRKLKSFQIAQLVYDVTLRFCDRYMDRRSRTYDQMVQAARSGVQNIAEGSKASGTSKKTELKLTNVARASLEELKLDYQDFLRHKGLPQWERNDPRNAELVALRFRQVEQISTWIKEVHDRNEKNGHNGLNGLDGQNGRKEQFKKEPTLSIQATYPEIAANAALTLIMVACSLLDRQIAAQARAFEQEGGFTERLYRIRKEFRGKREPFQ